MGPRSNQPKRRTFSADYKLAMVAEVAAAVGERRRLKFPVSPGTPTGATAASEPAACASGGRLTVTDERHDADQPDPAQLAA
jgi:hypothetical protein